MISWEGVDSCSSWDARLCTPNFSRSSEGVWVRRLALSLSLLLPWGRRRREAAGSKCETAHGRESDLDMGAEGSLFSLGRETAESCWGDVFAGFVSVSREYLRKLGEYG